MMQQILLVGFAVGSARSGKTVTAPVEALMGRVLHVWSVIAATDEARRELQSVQRGDALACMGPAESKYADRRMMAERVIAFRPAETAGVLVEPTSDDEPAVDNMIELALRAGARAERQRIAEIIRILAERGASLEEAARALNATTAPAVEPDPLELQQ